jgi:hypothetical protein
MQTHTTEQDSWWYERPTKAADLSTGLRPLSRPRHESESVWMKALGVVVLMFALGLALIALIGR